MYMPTRNISSLLVKPAGANCNLKCDYCFYLEKSSLFDTKVLRMNESTLTEMSKQSSKQSGTHLSFVWQGGEPCLLGLDFFKRVIDLQLQYAKGKTITNVLQTNGTLLNIDWVKFLSRYKFLLGLSIDGPEKIHNSFRVNLANKGSWKQVMQNYFLLKEHNVAVNALAVVHKLSAKNVDLVYDFFKLNSFHFVQYIPIFEKNENGLKHFSLTSESYGVFLCRLLDRWVADLYNGTALNIRTFDAIFENYVGIGSSECTFNENCGGYLVVEHNGNTYSCDYFVSNEAELGNLHKDRLVDVFNSDKHLNFTQQKQPKNNECAICEYLIYCNSGCPKHWIKGNDNKRYNYYCSSYKQFFQKAHPKFLELKEIYFNSKKNRPGKTYDATHHF